MIELPENAMVTGKVQIVTFIDPANPDDYMIAAMSEGPDDKNLPLITSFGMLELAKGLLLQAQGE